MPHLPAIVDSKIKILKVEITKDECIPEYTQLNINFKISYIITKAWYSKSSIGKIIPYVCLKMNFILILASIKAINSNQLTY